MRNEMVRTMCADLMKWLKWVGFFLIMMAFPALLIVISKECGEMVPGILIGIAMYFVIFSRKKKSRQPE